MYSIGLFDSGTGGLNILKYCLEKSPNFRYVYYVDDLNAPFGDKPKKEIKELAYRSASFLINEKKVDMLIVACNTATAVAIEYLRECFKGVNIIGVEPPILPALREHKKGKILVFATEATLKYNKLLNRFNDDFIQKIYVPNLPKKIDDNIYNLKNIKLDCFNGIEDVESVVLGCTHFYAIKENIVASLKYRPKFYFSGEGVSDYLYKLVGKGSNKSSIEIISSSKRTDYLYNRLASLVDFKT